MRIAAVLTLAAFLSILCFHCMVNIPVGLDIGTGYTKVSGGKRSAVFPTLCAMAQAKSVRNVEDMDIGSDGGPGIIERVGDDAVGLDLRREWIMVRPVRHGLPYDRRGYAMVARHALKLIGVKPERSVICAGVTYDAKKYRGVVRNIIMSLKPVSCAVIPQVIGTLVSCGRESGMVINIGHGTTEIISVHGGSADGISIPKASDFVISQISRRNSKSAYVDHEGLFARNAAAVGRLVPMLAAHIADEVVRIGSPDEVVLAGGGSLIPGMADALSKAVGCSVIPVDDPVMSNAVGFEAKAAVIAGKLGEEPPASKPQ